MNRSISILNAALNLCTLVVGVTIGFFAGTWHQQAVFAQVLAPSTQSVEEVSPNFSSGSAAFGTLLAGRLAADQIAVQGIDLIKLDTNILNLLASKPNFSAVEVQAVIGNSKADKILQMKQPEKPKEEKK